MNMVCSSAEPCGDGDVCYRGFCLPEQGRVLSPVGPGDASVIYIEVESDGSIVLVEIAAGTPGIVRV